jgi:hypothetical protein
MPTLVSPPRPVPLAPPPQPVSSPDWPVYRSIVALDLERSTQRTNPVKRALRDRMYCLLAETLRGAGIEAHNLDRLTDRGDGVLALIRPADEVPKTVLLDAFVPQLIALLAEHNATMVDSPHLQMRLRVVVHAGDIHDDGKGFFGEELDVAFRLLDAPQVKRALSLSPAPLVLVISDEIFRAIVWHGYGAINAGAYARRVRVKVADRHRQGWIHLPGLTQP